MRGELPARMVSSASPLAFTRDARQLFVKLVPTRVACGR